MRKNLLFIVLICLVSSSFSQSTKFGVVLGVNQTSLIGSNQAPSSLYGYRAGGFADISLGHFSFQPGLYYTQKGAKGDITKVETFSGVNYTYHTTADIETVYLEVPVNILYHVPVIIGDIFVGGGPYFGVGTQGVISTSYSATASSGISTSHSERNNVTFGSGQNDMKNPDYGLNAVAGLEFKNHFLIDFGYSAGLRNLDNSGGSLKNKVLSVSVGYTFF